MGKIVAIGGGENGRVLEDGSYASYDTKTIDEEIVRLTNKDNPNFLFLGHAMTPNLDIELSYYETMKLIYKGYLGCNCDVLYSNKLDDKELVMNKINKADIIYEGGGDTSNMIKLWKQTGFDEILYNAYKDNKVICGVSAGACMIFKSCNSDTVDGFESVDCLNWFNYHLTPHANEEGRIESTKEELKNNGLKGLIMSNSSALEIIDNKYRVLKDNPDAFIYEAYWDNDKYYIKELDEKGNI